MKGEDVLADRGTVSWLVCRYVAGRTDITPKAQEQYAWAIPHIEAGLGAIRLAMLDREDVVGLIEGLAHGGKLSKRSVQICRTALRTALTEAIDEGLIPRSPAALAAAIPGSVDDLPHHYRVISNNTDVARLREHPIAVVIAQAVSSPADFSDGRTWTWLKLTKPAVEGARQAFLDP